MTTTYKTELKTIEQKVFVSCICDWCGKSLPDHYGRKDDKTREFEFVTGYSYSDDCGGNGWYIEDLCDECVEKLRNLLVESGIKITGIDY